MQTDELCLMGKLAGRHHGAAVEAGDHHVTEPWSDEGLDRPEPPGLDSLVSGDDQPVGAEALMPDLHDIVHRAIPAVEVPKPSLSPISWTPDSRSGSSSTLILASAAMSTMP